MKLVARAACALLALCVCAPALAQITLPPVKNPGGAYVPAQGAVLLNPDGSAVSASNPLPTGRKDSIFWNGSASPLGSSATYTGTTRDIGVASGTAHGAGYFNAFFLTDQSGTAYIEASDDGTTFYAAASASLSASSPVILTVPVFTRYYRAKVVNGTNAETSLRVSTSFTGG